MRHSKRTTLSTDDVDSALTLRNVEVRTSSLLYNSIAHCLRHIQVCKVCGVSLNSHIIEADPGFELYGSGL